MISALVISAALTIGTMANDISDGPEYVDLGECRITEYCPSCNDGSGHESSSGVYLEYGHAACRWLKNGTIIDIEGERFEIVDTCGTDAIDIFVDTETCQCNLNEYRHVSIVKE